VDRAGLVSGRARELRTLIGSFVVSFAIFAFAFGDWRFGLGFVVLILIHELGHFAEARRQGVHATLPTFVPFIGAYVLIRSDGLAPWRNALISLAGPFAGGVGAAAVWWFGSARGTSWLVELAYYGFLLNAANLLPFGFLDGGGALRGITETWRRPAIRYDNGVPVEAFAPERNRAVEVAVLYGLLAAALVVCAMATRHSGAF
jgi:Zn-dependent protease